MIKKKNHQNANNLLREKLNATNETAFVLRCYRDIVNNIVNAYLSGMSFIPFLEWTNQLDTCMFVEEHDEELNELIASLKYELKELASSFHYVGEDKNGFLIKITNSGTCSFAGDSKLQKGEKQMRRKRILPLTIILCSIFILAMYNVAGSYIMTKVVSWAIPTTYPQNTFICFFLIFVCMEVILYPYYLGQKRNR